MNPTSVLNAQPLTVETPLFREGSFYLHPLQFPKPSGPKIGDQQKYWSSVPFSSQRTCVWHASFGFTWAFSQDCLLHQRCKYGGSVYTTYHTGWTVNPFRYWCEGRIRSNSFLLLSEPQYHLPPRLLIVHSQWNGVSQVQRIMFLRSSISRLRPSEVVEAAKRRMTH